MKAESTLKLIEPLQGPLLFKELPALLDSWQWLVVAAAFLFLAYGHVVRSERSSSNATGVMSVWLKTLLCIGFVVTGPLWSSRLLEASTSAYTQSKGDGCYGVANRCIRLVNLFPDLERVLGVGGAAGDQPSGFVDLKGYSEELWEGALADEGLAVSDADEGLELDSPVAQAMETTISIKAGTLFASYVMSALSLYGLAFLNILMEAARYMVLACLLFLMPLLVAGTSLPSVKLASERTLRLAFFTAFVPLLWLVGNMGTAGLFNFHASILAPGAEGSADPVTWKSIENTDTKSLLNSIVYARQGMNLSYSGAGRVAGSSLLLFLWGSGSLLLFPWLAWHCLGLLVPVVRDGGGRSREVVFLRRSEPVITSINYDSRSNSTSEVSMDFAKMNRRRRVSRRSQSLDTDSDLD